MQPSWDAATAAASRRGDGSQLDAGRGGIPEATGSARGFFAGGRRGEEDSDDSSEDES